MDRPLAIDERLIEHPHLARIAMKLFLRIEASRSAIAELGTRKCIVMVRAGGRFYGGERVAARRRLLVGVSKRKHATASGT